MFLTQFLQTITMKWIACYAFPYSTINRNFKSIDRLFLQMNLAGRMITSTACPKDRDNWQYMTCALDFLIQIGIRLSWSESIHTHWRTNSPEDRKLNNIEVNDIAPGNRHRATGKMIGTSKADTTAKETIGINQADTTAREKDHTLPNLHHRIGENQDGMDNNGKVGMVDIVKPIQTVLVHACWRCEHRRYYGAYPSLDIACCMEYGSSVLAWIYVQRQPWISLFVLGLSLSGTLLAHSSTRRSHLSQCHSVQSYLYFV